MTLTPPETRVVFTACYRAPAGKEVPAARTEKRRNQLRLWSRL